MKKIMLQATIDNLHQVQQFIEAQMEEKECSMKGQMQVSVATEEIYVNIARYAYALDTGKVMVSCDIQGAPPTVRISFEDEGIPFNPLLVKEADTTLSAEDRKIGGLGILMVRKSMDEVLYEYKDGKNILTLVKQC